jgi:hypothetical protein
MNTLAALPGNAWLVGPEVSPWIKWRDHSNDPINYGGEYGTRMELGHARAVVEMMEYDPGYSHRIDMVTFTVGHILLKKK